MTASDWIALGIGLAGLGALGLGAIWRLNHTLTLKISAGDTKLHEKLDVVHRDYVRRDDLRDDIQRLERGQESLATKMDGMVNAMMPAMARMTEAAVSMRRQQTTE